MGVGAVLRNCPEQAGTPKMPLPYLTALEFQFQAILLTYSDLRQGPLLPKLQCLHLCTEEGGTKCSAGILGQLLALFEPQV